MKKVAALAAALIAFGATPSMAQGYNLSFDNCGTAGTSTVAINCASNTGGLITMHASVFPYWAMNTFGSAQCIIDVRVGGGFLPPWWQTNAGQCRANAIRMSFDPNDNLSDCPDVWAGNPNLQVTATQQGINSPDRVRFNGVAAFPAGSEIPLATGTELWVCRVTISMAGTTTCAGCSQAATIVLNQISLKDPNQPEKYVSNPANNACIFLNGGQPLCASGATPAQNRTWGAVKGLYH